MSMGRHYILFFFVCVSFRFSVSYSQTLSLPLLQNIYRSLFVPLTLRHYNSVRPFVVSHYHHVKSQELYNLAIVCPCEFFFPIRN